MTRRQSLWRTAFLVSVVAHTALAASTVSVGPEFQINTYTTDDQGGVGPADVLGQAVCSDPAGNFTVVWTSHNQATPIGNGTMLFGQRYDSSGAPQGTEFQVNSYTSSIAQNAVMACDTNGFQVVWWDFNTNLSGRRFDSSGVAQGTEFALTPVTYQAELNQGLSMCRAASGDSVVVYNSLDGSFEGVFAQRFDSSGAKLGTEFQVNSYTTNYQTGQHVSCDSAGNFVVVWTSGVYFGTGPDGDGLGIFAQRYDSAGAALGTNFQVNTYTKYSQRQPVVSSDPSGNFVIVWSSPGFSNQGVLRGRRYDSNGAPQGPEFAVNSNTHSGADGIAVASDSSGGFVVTWGGDNHNVFGRAFDSTGAARGPDFQVNTYVPPLLDDNPDVGVSGDGKTFVVTWTQFCNQGSLGACEDGSGNGVFGQRFAIGHDSVARPRAPLNVAVPKNPTSPKVVTVAVKVTNADPKNEVPGDNIQLTVNPNDCPSGMIVGTPNFAKKMDPPTDTVLLAGGKSATGKFTLAIHSGDFASYNFKAPKRCTLLVTATTLVAGNDDPTPENNVVPVEVSVVDKNVAETATVHETVIKSAAPIIATIAKNKLGVLKKSSVPITNADYLVMNDSDTITLSVDPASIAACPWLIVASLDADPATPTAESMVTLAGGKSKTGKIQFTIANSVTTKNLNSPARCVALVKATGPMDPDHDASNNATQVVIDVIDKNDQ